MIASPRPSREMTEEAKLDVASALQELARMGKLPRGTIKIVAARFKLDRCTVRKLWRRYEQGSVKSRKKGRVGPKHRNMVEEIKAKIRQVPQQQRTTMRDLSQAMVMSISTLSRALHKGTMTRRSSRLKPLLTDQNKSERLAFCRSHVQQTAETAAAYQSVTRAIVAEGDDGPEVGEADVPAGKGSRVRRSAPPNALAESAARAGILSELDFSGMWDVVHLDEKWFNADKYCQKTNWHSCQILLADE